MPEVAKPDVVRTQRCGAITRITMNRPEYGNAQNSAMTYALDDAFYAAADDDEVKVIILAGEGKHFSAGHDIGPTCRCRGPRRSACPRRPG